MRLQSTGILLASFLVPAFCAIPRLGSAQEPNDTLPLTKVIMFNTGVAYFEHQGNVSDNTEVELSFETLDMNDLLKSMVLEDMDGGHIRAVSYAPSDPAASQLKSFDIDLTEPPTIAMLLTRLRGELVTVHHGQPTQGAILSVETRVQQAAENLNQPYELLNLMTAEGIQSINLSNLDRLEFNNPQLNHDMKQALLSLTKARRADRRSISIRCQGEGTRRVRVGYVLECPAWKTSYRLVLNEDERSVLQGWAIVENATTQDWNDVSVSLVSGHPVSFRMNLYEPLFVDRPTLDLPRADGAIPMLSERGRTPRQTPTSSRGGFIGGFGGAGFGGSFGGGGLGGVTADAPTGGIDLERGVTPNTSTAELGEQFEYHLADPVSLADHSSAMVPILNQTVNAERLLLFNPLNHASHPYDAALLKNPTPLHLSPGPITVFAGGAYAGDAVTRDIPPGGEQLISFAINSKVDIEQQEQTTEFQPTSVRLEQNAIVLGRGRDRTVRWIIVNQIDQTRPITLELQKADDWTLQPHDALLETTANHHRFRIDVAANSSAELLVKLRDEATERIAMTEINDSILAMLRTVSDISDDANEFVNFASSMRHQMSELEQQITQVGQTRQTLLEEQSRIRQNMDALDRTSQLYHQYVATLTDQEATLKQLVSEATALQARRAALERQLQERLQAGNGTANASS